MTLQDRQDSASRPRPDTSLSPLDAKVLD